MPAPLDSAPLCLEQVMRAQVELVARYDLAHEVVGTGIEARLRILPAAAALPTGIATAGAPVAGVSV